SIHYIALEEIHENSQKYPAMNLNFSGTPTTQDAVILDADVPEQREVQAKNEVGSGHPDDAEMEAILERSTKARRNPNPSLEVLQDNPDVSARRPPAKKVSSG